MFLKEEKRALREVLSRSRMGNVQCLVGRKG